MRFVIENSRSFLLSLFAFFVLACGGGSCGGCESCGVAPIPGGYPIADRVDNSAQIRLTDDGIGFIEDNIGEIVANFLPGGLDFDVPRTSTGSGLTSVTICPDNDCVAHLEIQDIDLTPTAPNTLHAHLRLILDSRNPAGDRARWRLDLPLSDSNMDVDTRRGSREYIGFEADIRFLEETEAARNGYTWISVENADLVSGEDIENADLDFSGGLLSWLLNAVKGILIDQLVGQITGLLDSALGDALCTQQGEFGCPTGTVAAGPDPTDICEYTAGGRCVPTLLGTDGQGDLGQAFLGGISPGTHAPGQFLLASGGEGEAVNNGMSLFFYGGYRSTDLTFTTSPAHNPCVPVIDPPAMPAIARADTFRNNIIPGSGASAHVGIGLSESFLNHAGYGMFDSGLLCIGAGTRLSQQLSSGLLSALISSLRNLTFPEANAAVAIALRPQLPPDFEVGAGTDTEALLTITLPSVEIDFYIWSTERYIRFMTYSADLAIPVNLAVADGEIVPEIVSVSATNSVVTNSEQLTEDPMLLATLIETVISEFASMLTGGLSPFALPDLMGLALEVPDGGVTGVDDAGEEFVGIFANLAVASSGMPYSATVDTLANIEPIQIDPVALALETYGEGELPSVRVVADAEGPHNVDYEYSWRVNGKPWSRWTPERVLDIQDSAFLLQARHELEVRARVLDEPLSVDPTPAYFEVLVDVLAPFVNVERSGRGVHITASDVLTQTEALELRYQIDGEGWTDWQSLPSEAFVPLPYDDADIEVEVRDEAGNVGGASAALIRGLPNAETDSGCGCSTFESKSTPWTSLAFLMAFGLFLMRRRSLRPRRVKGDMTKQVGRVAKGLSILMILAVVGCDCSGDDPPDGMVPMDCSSCVDAVPPATNGTACCMATNMCVAYDLVALCDPGFLCADAGAVVVDEACAVTCSDCVRQPALEPGLLATHLDMHVGDDGSAVISGYSPGDAPARRYGDLVIGTAPPGPGEMVTWEIVDGAPQMPITNDPDGYRGGVSEAGPDVGRWTSIAESGGTYFVSYYDKDLGALKLAIGSPGAWSVTTVDDTGDSGRYSSIAIDAAGNPNIAYLQITRGDAGTGDVISRVKVAVADSPSPAGPPDWVSTEIGAGAMLCRPAFCDAGETCTEAGQCVFDSGDCAAACMSDEVCTAASCETALPDTFVEDMPPAYGIYNSLVATATGLALVFYDRSSGNLWGSQHDGTSWAAPFLIDGYATSTLGVGDSGLAASLFVDAAGVWHVSYVDGAEENLRYARIDGGVVTAEVVDDGSTDGTAPNPDGRHIVGDDSSIIVTEGGEIRIAYQDATSQRAMMARRPATGGAWTVSIFDEADSTGFWVEQGLLGSTSVIATYYRATGVGAVRLFNID